MRAETIRRITRHHATLAPKMDEVSRVFFEKLFQKNPDVRGLFPVGMGPMHGQFAAAVSLICRNLDNFSALEGPLMALGAQHVEYGVRPEHYPIVRDLLVEAIRDVSGAGFDDQLGREWTELFNNVGAAMLRGAAGVALGAARGLTVTTPARSPWTSKNPESTNL